MENDACPPGIPFFPCPPSFTPRRTFTLHKKKHAVSPEMPDADGVESRRKGNRKF